MTCDQLAFDLGDDLRRKPRRDPAWYDENLPAWYLRERLAYHPESGVLIWRDHVHLPPRWRTRHVGKPAFNAKRTDGYLQGAVTVPGVGLCQIRAHRAVWAIVYGCWPRHLIDHRNRVRDDNRLLNLRAATQIQNGRNLSLDGFGQKRPALGVSRHNRREKWCARIGVNGRSLHLGYFIDLADAVRARCEAECLHGWPDRGVTVEERISRALARASESEKPRGGF